MAAMKDILRASAILLILVLAAGPAPATTRVFLLGGQSNMAGLGGYDGIPAQSGYNADQPCPAPYSATQSAVQFWNYGTPGYLDYGSFKMNYPSTGDGWVNLQPIFGYKPNEFGPEVSFGYRLHQLYPNDQIYLVKEGVTSQNLAVNWNPDISGNVYSIFKDRVNAAMANLTAAGKSPVISGMIWMQGESDAMNHDYATAYATNLAHFISTVRSDFYTPNMPFVVGRINNYAWGTPGDNALVRSVETTVPAQVGHASWINTDDLEWAYDGHYGTQGQINLGLRFANAITVLPEPSALVLLGIGLTGLLAYAARQRT
jgi:hypothetical protein